MYIMDITNSMISKWSVIYVSLSAAQKLIRPAMKISMFDQLRMFIKASKNIQEHLHFICVFLFYVPFGYQLIKSIDVSWDLKV